MKLTLFTLLTALVSAVTIPMEESVRPLPVGDTIQDVAHTGELVAIDMVPVENMASGSPFSVGVNVELNPLEIGQAIANAVNTANNREAVVKNAVNTAWFQGRGKYNVMVFNLRQNYYWQVQPDASRTAYGSFNYGGITFGVWMFKGEATFQSQGDGGWINWGFYGAFDRNGGNVKFYTL
jgi:hypothetical protein